jgi:thiamine pyrophosphokinase
MPPARIALVVADGDVDEQLLRALMTEPGDGRLCIAADGGAARVLDQGLAPDLVIGDFDSLAPAARERLASLGVEMRASGRDKDESDMELCLLAALAAGARSITILGALGLVRPEHTVANLLLLADPRLDGVEVVVAGRGSRAWRIGSAAGRGETAIHGHAGDFVSLLPLGGTVSGVTTHGLRFALRDASLPVGPSRGLSNELVSAAARVASRRGCLLVIHTARSMADAPATGGA